MAALRLALCVTLTSLGACSAAPVKSADVEHYTGILLCPSAVVRDLTTGEERNTTPGFSFHVEIVVKSACEASFRKQLAALPTSGCAATANLSGGCFVKDAFPKASKSTSIMVFASGEHRYDLRFYS